MVSRSVGLADDYFETSRAALSALRFVQEVFDLRDGCWQHQQARGRQHDPTSAYERQARHDGPRYVRGARQ